LIDKKSRIPLYAQLIDIIVGKMNSGELKENDKLPSERELCDFYDVSRTTVRQAMVELENEGYIYKEHGKGSFVSPKVYTQSLVKMYSFTEEMKKLGKKPRSEIISFDMVPATVNVAKKLLLEEFDQVYRLVRLRLADDEPIMYETTYMPVNILPNLSLEDLKNSSLYGIFQVKYAYVISNAFESFRAVSIRDVEEPYLLVKAGLPALKIERTAFADSKALEYTISVARGDKYVYTTELK
jgi:GntR family transcriptional regulator